ncbi:MAG: outer membrane protein assembly factor BamD [Myxococcales bacterium]|nr:MAG: outer membrane protein assembly factor BamD [Myxococcales bacterium]
MKNRGRIRKTGLPLFWAAFAAATTLAACNQEDRFSAELRDMRIQLADLNRKVADQNVRFEEMNNRLYILEDRVSQEGAESTAPDETKDLKVVKLVPGARTPAAGSETLTSQGETVTTDSKGQPPPKLISNWNLSGSSGGKDAARADAKGDLLREYEAALELYRAGRYAEAVAAFGQFVVKHGKTSYADNATFWMGVCFYEQSEYALAIGEFEKLERYPQSNKRADALYYLGLSHKQLGDQAAADKAWRELLETFPASDSAKLVRGESQSAPDAAAKP